MLDFVPSLTGIEMRGFSVSSPQNEQRKDGPWERQDKLKLRNAREQEVSFLFFLIFSKGSNGEKKSSQFLQSLKRQKRALYFINTSKFCPIHLKNSKGSSYLFPQPKRRASQLLQDLPTRWGHICGNLHILFMKQKPQHLSS